MRICRSSSDAVGSEVNCFLLLIVLLSVLLSTAVQSASASYVAAEQEPDDVDSDDGQLYSLDGDSELRPRHAAELSGRREHLKKLLLLALMKQAEEERMEKAEEEPRFDERFQQQQKRGRWQGFCFRRTRSGRILPYICWKGSDF